MIKLVAFDWNGTILSDTICCLEGDNAVFKKLGIKPINLKEFRRAFDVPIINFYKNIGINPEKANKHFQENENLFHITYEERAEHSRTRANTRKLLTWLQRKKIKSIIFSNHTQTGINKHLLRLSIKKYFSNVIANEAIGLIFHGRSKGEKLKNQLKANRLNPGNWLSSEIPLKK